MEMWDETMKNIGMKILTVVLAVMMIIFNIISVADIVKAKRFKTYDTVTAVVVTTEDVMCNISSRNRNGDETSTDMKYEVDAYQTVEVQYDYMDATYTTELKKLTIAEGRTYYSRSEAERGADTLKHSGYKIGDSIDVYTNGKKAMSVREANQTGGFLNILLYVVVADIIMPVIIVIMVKIYFCKPDGEE